MGFHIFHFPSIFQKQQKAASFPVTRCFLLFCRVILAVLFLPKVFSVLIACFRQHHRPAAAAGRLAEKRSSRPCSQGSASGEAALYASSEESIRSHSFQPSAQVKRQMV